MPVNKIKNRNLILGWLKKAGDDLAFAKTAFADTEFYDHVCFLSQQAVEKYLKAAIIIVKGYLGKEDRTHNLIYLANVCQKYEINLSSLESYLRKLTEAYIPARYPVSGYVKYNKADAKECLNSAQEVVEYLKSKIDFSFYYNREGGFDV